MNFRAYFLGKEMKNLGHQVRIFAGSYSHLFNNKPKINGRFTNEIIDGLDYVWVRTKKYKHSNSPGRIFSMFQFLWNLFFLDKRKIEKPDVIIVSSISSVPYLVAKPWAKKYKAKLIFEVRDLWPLTLVELGRNSKYHPFIQFLQRIENSAYKHADKVISVLPDSKQYMMQHGLDPDKFVYIPNGIDLAEFQGNGFANRATYQLPFDKFIIGYVGSIGIANAMDTLIETAILCKDDNRILFVIIGAGDEKVNLEKMVESNGLTNVYFKEPVIKNDVQALLHCFDACYIGWRDHKLYKYGISANKIFDYMLSERPIIHASSASNDPIAEAKCGISVAPENPAEIRKALHQLLEMNQEERKQLGKNGLEYVIKNHDYKILAEKYLKVIKSIL